MLAFSVSAAALANDNAQTNSGFAYTLHTARPSVDELGQFPPAYENPTTEHVLQGPKHTLIWRDRVSERTVDNASFALGERHMGLYIPYWPQDKSASDASGWEEYGDKITYGNFNVKVEPGEEKREIAGGMAQHYVLTADYTRQLQRDPVDVRYQLSADLWILTDKPFSFAPFHTAGAYEDPRFDAALVAELSELGMVARCDTRHSSVVVDANGQEIGSKHEGTWTTWIVDLKTAEVPVLNMPVGDQKTLKVLQNEFRKQADDTCKAVMAGATPGFIQQNLNSEQQAAVVTDLLQSCKHQTMRAYFRNMKSNPQSVCGDILAGKLPEVAKQTFSEDEQKEFMQITQSFCEKQ
ncbi:MAG: hypothetical protein DWP95_13290 [Proteobacteria bacterium]|nr:MAG: hypothetical protein DWP95_13290 [Pseudomonadota bacterium]